MFMCSGIYRQEVYLTETKENPKEISYLSYPIEDVKKYSALVQQRLGWNQSEPNLGWVDLASPDALLLA
ncbi:hypothetical protein N7462_011080 [Penicillium macrosclerotiorum]|uniref:uncharacterized protein n=1 Tax=Penicillium macrosclerotiorum TaxID=303699 RepID=UPI002547B6BE|nr:uncharacterized protein N7462_011080 [Penicillium macrosclerotiorum]KAJ5666671.1 hypothetical protein N7462_011080 [Penicillium macrosclerotiorum]